MAISFGNNTTSATTSTSTVTSRTFAHNNDVAFNNVLVVAVMTTASTALPTSVTYNGVSMTSAVTESGGSIKNAIYYLVDAASGSNNVVVNFSSRQDRYVTVIAQTLNNVDDVTTIGSTGSHDTNTTMTVNHSGVVSDSVLIDMVSDDGFGSITPQDSQTLVVTESTGNGKTSMYKKTSPSASQRTQYTETGSANNALSSVEFLELSVTVPTLDPATKSNIFETTANIASNVTDDGGGTITERGVVYDTSTGPDINDSKTTTSGTTGAFNVDLSALTPNTLYYARGFATNGAGAGYSSEIAFLTDEDKPNSVMILDNPITFS